VLDYVLETDGFRIVPGLDEDFAHEFLELRNAHVQHEAHRRVELFQLHDFLANFIADPLRLLKEEHVFDRVMNEFAVERLLEDFPEAAVGGVDRRFLVEVSSGEDGAGLGPEGVLGGLSNRNFGKVGSLEIAFDPAAVAGDNGDAG